MGPFDSFCLFVFVVCNIRTAIFMCFLVLLLKTDVGKLQKHYEYCFLCLPQYQSVSVMSSTRLACVAKVSNMSLFQLFISNEQGNMAES